MIFLFCFYNAVYLQRNRNKKMNFLEFKDKLFDFACFNINQLYAWQPDFDRNNLTRWIKKGYIIRLRQGYYAFPEYKRLPDYAFYFSNRIYRPSYISLHTALAFYGMIPEAVVQITGVTSLKTASFCNDFGEYSYKNVKENLMFGYELKPMDDVRTLQFVTNDTNIRPFEQEFVGRSLQFASPEKALLDLLYLYPFYNSEQEMKELRLDEDYLHDDLKKDLLACYCLKFQCKALDRRLNLLFKTYDL